MITLTITAPSFSPVSTGTSMPLDALARLFGVLRGLMLPAKLVSECVWGLADLVTHPPPCLGHLPIPVSPRSPPRSAARVSEMTDDEIRDLAAPRPFTYNLRCSRAALVPAGSAHAYEELKRRDHLAQGGAAKLKATGKIRP